MENGTADEQLQLHPLDTRVSYGLDVTKPARWNGRPVGELLLGISSGEWMVEVGTVRVLDRVLPQFPQFISDPHAIVKEAKEQLPYVTWSGEFSYRRAEGLQRHLVWSESTWMI